MTAEIAIMNSKAVALAADSAVTWNQEKGQKIFVSENKLFMLSKYYPIGIMIYGNANFMGNSWESIIKAYRKKLNSKKFNYLKDYANDFVKFLESRNPLFPNNQSKLYIEYGLLSFYNYIKKEINDEIGNKFKSCHNLDDKQIGIIVKNIINKHYSIIRRLKKLSNMPLNQNIKIKNKYSNVFNSSINQIFERLPMDLSEVAKLKYIGSCIFTKDIFPENISGLVIAGFGEKDIFPNLISYEVDGIFENKLKYKISHSTKIDFKNTASIIPFAQKEMVQTFMEGIDPSLYYILNVYITKTFTDYPKIVVNNIQNISHKNKLSIQTNLNRVSTEILKNFKETIENAKYEKFISSILKVVSLLPKDELASMAEALVNLTSFKRKVSTDTETVGGPIDVAVISKGDGFIWVKRKHYFKSELNPHFFSNYYRR